MLSLNVSLGIYAFLPMGWLFMAFVILGEAFLMSWYLTGKKIDKRIYLSAALSNIASGAVGIATVPGSTRTISISIPSTSILISKRCTAKTLARSDHRRPRPPYTKYRRNCCGLNEVPGASDTLPLSSQLTQRSSPSRAYCHPCNTSFLR